MIYALNVYNIVNGKENRYREYAVQAGKLLKRVGGSVLVAGKSPLRMEEGDMLREYFLVVQFLDEDAFADFLDLVGQEDLHRVRQETTTDYLWTVYQDWNLEQWISAWIKK